MNLRKLKTPEFYVEAHGYGVSVGWKDAERRYHFWLDENGNINGNTLHSNLLENPGPRARDGHRALKINTKRWAPVVEAIMAQVKTGDLIAKAFEETAAKLKADEEERIRAANEEALERLEKAIVHLPRPVGSALRALPEATRLAFVATFN